MRQKEERKAREEKLVEVGLILAEAKVARKRKKLHQEDHQDDCGSDLGPLEEKALVSAFVVDGPLGSAISYSFLDGSAFASDSAGSSQDEFGRILNSNFSRRSQAFRRRGWSRQALCPQAPSQWGNFDLDIGFDLINPKHQTEVVRYILSFDH